MFLSNHVVFVEELNVVFCKVFVLMLLCVECNTITVVFTANNMKIKEHNKYIYIRINL